MNPPVTQMLNGVTRGDCLDVMNNMPSQSIDFILPTRPTWCIAALLTDLFGGIRNFESVIGFRPQLPIRYFLFPCMA